MSNPIRPHQAGLLLLGAALAGSVQAAEMPQELDVRVGGFLGPSYLVQLKDGQVRCTTIRAGRTVGETVYTPPPAAWQALRSGLDDLAVWQWQKSYYNPNVLDGTQWRVRIAYPDRQLSSEGSNSFPDARGQSNNAPEQTESFTRFRALFPVLGKGCQL